ncbi:MAG: hypothetical protein ABR922_17480 [Streptosporangiaceae bacterium]
MTSTSDPEHAIFLLPLEDAEPGPLRRWLGREAWLKTPVVTLSYEADGDRVMFRLIDTPSTARGLFDEEHPPEPDADLFIGFDGADTDAWLTTVALLGFRRHCDQGTSQFTIAQELLGAEVWEAAISLRQTSGGEREITISQDEVSRLICRWSDLVVSLDGTGPSDEALDAALAEWSTNVARQKRGGPATGCSTAPGSPGTLNVSSPRALAVVPADAMSRSGRPGGSSAGDGRNAGQQLKKPEATGAGAAMARRSPAGLNGESPGPVRYGPLARLSDIWAARRDGNAEVPLLSTLTSSAHPAGPGTAVTPYMEIRHRHFLDWAEREHRRMLTDMEGTYRARAEVHQKIAAAEERAASARKVLDGMPNEPPEPARRNVVEQHVHEALVRSRRLREFMAERDKVLALEQKAMEEADQLRAEETRLSETITARERILDSRVRQLLHHSLRRCGTYTRHIVHHHPDGSAVVPYLEMARPSLPDWLPSTRPDGARADGQDGP